MKDKSKDIEFQPIRGEHVGYVALSIRPPGTWFNNKGYKVFRGGCGLGEQHTLPLAKAALLKAAIGECDERIAAAKKTIAHYTAEKAKLETVGLSEVRSPRVYRYRKDK